MGTKWREPQVKQHTKGEVICFILLAVVTVAWLFWAGATGQKLQEERPTKTCEWGDQCHLDYP